MATTYRPKMFWIGLAAYAMSFLAVCGATRDFGGGGWRGYELAFEGLLLPLMGSPFGPTSFFEHRLLEYFGFLISEWANIVFLVAAILILGTKRSQKLIAVIRIVVLSMIPFSWVFFYYEDAYPREGHFLWILGILLVLFSAKTKPQDAVVRN
jgi:hypothetical protein